MTITTYSTTSHPSYNTPVCARYQLHYKNRYGGYDTFVIEGKVVKKENYTRYTISKAYSNLTHDFGKTEYLNDVETTYELHTGWLTTKQSEMLAFHLLSSDRVYFHDTEENIIYPCVIKDNSTTYKTTKNDGMVSYTINIELSQNNVIQ